MPKSHLLRGTSSVLLDVRWHDRGRRSQDPGGTRQLSERETTILLTTIIALERDPVGVEAEHGESDLSYSRRSRSVKSGKSIAPGHQGVIGLKAWGGGSARSGIQRSNRACQARA
jgi:hypothetical protein